MTNFAIFGDVLTLNNPTQIQLLTFFANFQSNLGKILLVWTRPGGPGSSPRMEWDEFLIKSYVYRVIDRLDFPWATILTI